ncbi:SusC/RagA family TonB-linked outer membrane protein [Pedobacter sp.]|uniref:SusC/RagA family TonB-linked outer membrane protein n=1 Tax=Pedobacter sp. TaxID=1411316 RepID=UPI00280AC0B5|nr:SusC/RagA family TonB-linked outer membrane protein [Pedobacter sp.]
MMIFFCLVTVSAFSSHAQKTGTIKGKVIDNEGQPIPGASIKITPGNRNIASNNAGEYNAVLPEGTYTLVVSYLSYKTITETNVKAEAGKITTKNFALQVDAIILEERVVVTALGITREEKSLGYANRVVKAEELTDAISNNWTDALSGKVAGLNLVRSGGGPTGSNSIILRGESNLTGANDALIVVDGVVINHGSGRMVGTGDNAYANADSPADFGSGLNDINPEDIESVNVLKGPGAAALYGQRGANGAIIITTKSGQSKKGVIGVTLNSNSSIEQISRWPDWQYEYGQGTTDTYYSWGTTVDGATTRSTSAAWGPKFEGQSYYQYDPATNGRGAERTPWIAYPNAVKDFFEVGKTFTNSITLDGGNKDTKIRFSLTNVDNDWIIPNTGYKRNTVSLSASHVVNEKLSISSKINYTNKWSDNLPSTGYNNQTIMYWTIFWVPNGSLDWLKDYWVPGQEGILQRYPFSPNPDNPYVIANEMLNKSNRHGITGNINATYKFTKDFSLMVRTSLDFSTDKRSQQRPFDTEKFKEGMYRTQNIYSQESNSDFLFRYNKKISNKFQASVSAGGSHLQNSYVSDDIFSNALIYPQIFTLANSKDVLRVTPYRSQYVINSLYGFANFSYNNYLFLDVTGRNDWNSVLATPTSTDNVSFFYPSVNLSGIVSDMVNLPKVISYAKVRASFAGVGSGRNIPYQTFVGYTPAVSFPGGLYNQTSLANPNLKPLYTTSIEVGADLKLLKNRAGLSFTLYKSNTKNQILAAGLDRSTGVNTATVNSGEVMNKGLEIEADYQLLKKPKGLNWKIFSTYSVNINEVLSLTNDLPSLTLQTGPSSSAVVEARVGGNMAALYGVGYQRSPQGEIIFENGYPLLTTDMVYLGNVTPKWKASIGQEFRFRQFKLNMLFDGQYGGVAYSTTNAVNMEFGKLKSSLPGRDNGIIGKGVIRNSDGTFRPNDVIAENIVTYYTAMGARANAEGNTYSTNFIKFREARLDYTFNAKLNKKFKTQKFTVGVYGRDLFIWSSWPAYDPEFGTLNNGTIDRGFEVAQFPSTRTFGFNFTIGI